MKIASMKEHPPEEALRDAYCDRYSTLGLGMANYSILDLPTPSKIVTSKTGRHFIVGRRFSLREAMKLNPAFLISFLSLLLYVAPTWGEVVTATVYYAEASQIDSTPNITADNTRITNPQRQRIIALSRDLLSRWGGPYHYGDIVIVEGAGPYDGKWTVRDTMAKRWKLRCDFLISRGQPLGKWHNVTISRGGRP